MIRDILLAIFGLGLGALGVSGLMSLRHYRAIERTPPYEAGGERLSRRGVVVSVRVRAADKVEASGLASDYRVGAVVCNDAGFPHSAELLRQAADMITPIYGHSMGSN